jgi:hypothetical protein
MRLNIHPGNLLLILLLLISGCSASDEIKLPGSSGPLLRNYFGMHIHHADSTTPWPVANFGSLRLWDAHTMWLDLEPIKGQWRFERLDKLVDLAQSHGVEPMLTLGITPLWAASRPEERFVYGYGGNSPPKDMRDWENYVRTVATRYKGRIRYYELWNEPSFDELDTGRGFYAGKAQPLVDLGRAAYRILKQVDPANKMLSPGFTDDGDRLNLYLSLGGKDITDIVAHHFYAERPEAIPERVAKVRSVMARYGIADRPLWNTEAGYDIPESGEALTANGPATDLELGAYIARTLVIGAASRLDRFYWYSWERTMLSRWPEAAQSSPAMVAYRQAMRWLTGAVIKECATRDRRMWTCELNLGPHKAWMVWNTRDTLQWTPPADWHARQYETLDGGVTELEPGRRIALGPAPILVKLDAGLWSVYQKSP